MTIRLSLTIMRAVGSRVAYDNDIMAGRSGYREVSHCTANTLIAD